MSAAVSINVILVLGLWQRDGLRTYPTSRRSGGVLVDLDLAEGLVDLDHAGRISPCATTGIPLSCHCHSFGTDRCVGPTDV